MKRITTQTDSSKHQTSAATKQKVSRSGQKEHKRTHSQRYREDSKNEEEKILTSPVQESVPVPTEEHSDCQLLYQEIDQLMQNSQSSPSKANTPLGASSPAKSQKTSLFAWGNNSKGQICTNREFAADPIPIAFDQIKRLVLVACGESHTLIVSDQGFVYGMGDNSKCQLGITPSIKVATVPQKLENLLNPSSIACGALTSYAIAQNQLFSWGDAEHGALGCREVKSPTWKPVKVALKQEVKSISSGDYHAAAITTDGSMFVWGANTNGQLGLGNRETRRSPATAKHFGQLQVTQVSCGQDYTFIITQNNEILVSGKLPFTIEHIDNDKAVKTDYVTSFQSVAQFEQGVEVLQMETSKFATILVKPGDTNEPKELFLWGQTPLGIFQEPTSLNQLVAECQDGQQAQVFDVSAVKNGQNFSIFVDQTSGLTYQIGTEDLKDPGSSLGQVSLSELRDVKFNSINLFACGADFIIGESNQMGEHVPNKVLGNTLVTGLQCITEEHNTSVQSSASKIIKLNKIEQDFKHRSEHKSDIVNLQTPSHVKVQNPGFSQLSEHSFRQEALFKDDLTSTPVSNKFETAELPVKSKIRVPAIKISEKVAGKSESPNRKKSEITKCQKSFKKSKPPVQRRDESEGDDKMVTARDSHSVDSKKGVTPRSTMRGETPASNQAVFKTAQDDFKKQTVVFSDQAEIRKLDYSPIMRQSIVRDSIADLENEMNFHVESMAGDQSCFQPFDCRPHSRQPSEVIHTSALASCSPHAYGCKQIISDDNYISSHGPSAYGKNQDRILHYQRNLQHQSPSEMHRQTHLSNRYVPLQQAATIQRSISKEQLAYCHSTGQKQIVGKGNAYIQPTNLNAVFQSIDGNCETRVVNMSNLHASYCGPFLNNNLDQSIYQLELESMLVKDKVENLEQSLKDEKAKRQAMEQLHKSEMEQARAQVQEGNKQLERAGRDYAKLLSKIDEDQEETAQLREKVRSYESQIEQMSHKLQETTEKTRHLTGIREQLEGELKESERARKQAEESARVNHQSTSLPCTKEGCAQRVADLQDALTRKNQLANELSRRLGGIELQNKELVQELQDRATAHELRLKDLRSIAEKEIALEQERNERLTRQVEVLRIENEQFRQKQNATTIGEESAKKIQEIGMHLDRKFKEVERKKSEFFDTVSSARHLAQVEEPMVMRSSSKKVSQHVFLKPQDTMGYVQAAPFSEISSVQSNKHKKMMSVPKFDINASKLEIADNFATDLYKEETSLMKLIEAQSPQKEKTPVKKVTSSNSDHGCLQSSTQRRLRQQRTAKEAIENRSGAKSAREGARVQTQSHVFNQAQNQSTHQLATQRQSIATNNSAEILNNGSVTERSLSRLRQPTPITKSPGLKATLEMIEQQSSAQAVPISRLESNRMSADAVRPLNKNNSVTGLASRQDRLLVNLGQITHSQTNLRAIQDKSYRNTTPNQAEFAAMRPSFSQTKQQQVTPKTTAQKVLQQQEIITPRTGIVGPPTNLAARFEQKIPKGAQSSVVSTERSKPKFNHSASSASVGTAKRTYDTKRNNLLSNYTTHQDKFKQVRNVTASVNQDESDHLIDIMLAANLGDPQNDSRTQHSRISDIDISAQSIRPKQTFSPKMCQSYDPSQTPGCKNVLQDSTNGLSSIKDKLKAIQDNKQLLEKKIQEYEKKLKMIQRKGKKSVRESVDENSLCMSQFQSNAASNKSGDCLDKASQKKVPTPTQPYRNCMMKNEPYAKFIQQAHVQTTDRNQTSRGYVFNSNN